MSSSATWPTRPGSIPAARSATRPPSECPTSRRGGRAPSASAVAQHVAGQGRQVGLGGQRGRGAVPGEVEGQDRSPRRRRRRAAVRVRRRCGWSQGSHGGAPGPEVRRHAAGGRGCAPSCAGRPAPEDRSEHRGRWCERSRLDVKGLAAGGASVRGDGARLESWIRATGKSRPMTAMRGTTIGSSLGWSWSRCSPPSSTSSARSPAASATPSRRRPGRGRPRSPGRSPWSPPAWAPATACSCCRSPGSRATGSPGGTGCSTSPWAAGSPTARRPPRSARSSGLAPSRSSTC